MNAVPIVPPGFERIKFSPRGKIHIRLNKGKGEPFLCGLGGHRLIYVGGSPSLRDYCRKCRDVLDARYGICIKSLWETQLLFRNREGKNLYLCPDTTIEGLILRGLLELHMVDPDEPMTVNDWRHIPGE